MKIYTKTGDLGETGLLNARVKKSDLRIEVIGQLDELMSSLAMLIIELNENYNDAISDLKLIYRNIFIIQSNIADNEKKYNFNLYDEDIIFLEVKIDKMTEVLPKLTNFIYCIGHKSSVIAHQVRTKVRTVERLVVTLDENIKVDDILLKYLNRLSDYLFTLARFINKKENIEEEILKL